MFKMSDFHDYELMAIIFLAILFENISPWITMQYVADVDSWLNGLLAIISKIQAVFIFGAH